MRLETNRDEFGLIRTINSGGVIKNLTIESSSMTILSTPNVVYYLGFLVGRASNTGQPGNITISDCHSINNTITANSGINSVGFIAGNLYYFPNRNILVSDCSTKYSNLISTTQSVKCSGGNFGIVGLIYFTFSILFNFFSSNRNR